MRPDPRPRRLLREIGEGLRVVRGNRILLAISAHALSRDVGLSAWAIGLLGTASLTGALTAGLTARLLRRRRFFASYGVIVLNVFGMSFQ